MGKFGYKVYFTPMINTLTKEYGDEIDVSDRIKMSGVGSIRRSIDSADYDIGLFTFSDLELSAFNYNGYFNENDWRSIFPTERDLCKVRVVFQEIELVRDSNGTVLSETTTETSTFRGLINDAATRLDITNDTIRFKVLSRDSVFRTTKIIEGIVQNGMTFKVAFETILSDTRVTSILNLINNNINPDLDLEIDNGNWFDNKTLKEALDKLLLASNSVLLINDDGDIFIRSRVPDDTIPVVNLYRKNELHKRENIIDITSYNNGLQRTFNSFVISGSVNGVIATDDNFVLTYGLLQKKISLPFVSDDVTETFISNNLLNEFKAPKIELRVKVSSKLARTINLLDRVSVSYPLRITPPQPGYFLPVLGITELGDPTMPLPRLSGSLSIPARYGFKVLEIEDNPEKFTSTLLLRQIGKNLDDGIFDDGESAILGFAILGSAILGG